MKALVLNALGRGFDLDEVDIASPTGREVLVDVQASGLCHTDLLFAMHDIAPTPEVDVSLRQAEVFLELLKGEGFAKPNPRPMFPNPPGLLRLEPYSEGLRERIWWGSSSNATSKWARLGIMPTTGLCRLRSALRRAGAEIARLHIASSA